MHFEVRGGKMAALEVAIWPQLEESSTMKNPEPQDGYAEVCFLSRNRPLEAGAVVGCTLPVRAVQNAPSRSMFLSFGNPRPNTTVRVADSMLVGMDGSGQLAALWLLNLPGFMRQEL